MATEDGSVVKTLHINMLLPLTLPLQETEPDTGPQETEVLAEFDSSSEHELSLYNFGPPDQLASDTAGADTLSTPDHSVEGSEHPHEISVSNTLNRTVVSPQLERIRVMELPSNGHSMPATGTKQGYSPDPFEPPDVPGRLQTLHKFVYIYIEL